MILRMKALLVAVLLITVSGCGQPQGKVFIGHWVAVDSENSSYIDIREEGGIYHVDHSYHALWKGPDAIDVERLEGTPISDSVLRLSAGMASIDMRFQEGKIFLYGDGYSKSK